jgi:hypothetical protein
VTRSEKSLADRSPAAKAREYAPEALQGTTVGISLTPAIIQDLPQEEPARVICQNGDQASTGLQKKLAAQLVASLGKAAAIETCRANNWDGVLAQVLESSD